MRGFTEIFKCFYSFPIHVFLKCCITHTHTHKCEGFYVKRKTTYKGKHFKLWEAYEAREISTYSLVKKCSGIFDGF